MFVTFEGLDGAGKSTQVELLRAHLVSRGRGVVATREPGGTPLGEAVRDVLLNLPLEISPWAEAALFAAARAELADRVVRPALARGAVVVCDRYVDSSLAYQGVARGLGVDDVLELNLRATGGLLPDRTFLLVVDTAVAAERGARAPDRIERETAEFRALVEEGYRRVAELFPERVVTLDGTLPPDEIAARVVAALPEHARVS